MEHEYALLGGLNRALVGRYIGTIATVISSVAVFILLQIFTLANSLGWSAKVSPMLFSAVGAGTVYLALYWLFETRVWKFSWLSKIIQVPDLSGDWDCRGQTLNPDKSLGYQWTGTLTIVQSWDKLRIRLQTAQSASNSIAASLIYDKADGYRLLYNYKNEPRIGEVDLQPHRGFADFMFSHDLTVGDGEYFNGHGRFTFGTMKLNRKKS